MSEWFTNDEGIDCKVCDVCNYTTSVDEYCGKEL